MKFLFLCLMHLILFSILSTTIFILLKTWLSSGTTCSFKVWMFHSWPSTDWERIWLQNIELCISLHPSPIMNDPLSHQLSNFLEKYDSYHPLPLHVCNFSLTTFSKMYSFFPYHFPLKWIHSGSKPLLAVADLLYQGINRTFRLEEGSTFLFFWGFFSLPKLNFQTIKMNSELNFHL